MFGFIDESGAPGVAVHSKDYLVVSLVLFESKECCDNSIQMIDELREMLRLPEGYEFHCSSNSAKPQAGFLKLLSRLDFCFISIAIRKNDFKKTASYARISELLAKEMTKYSPKITVEMDLNQTLYLELRKAIRKQCLDDIKIRQRDSRKSRLIQVADYVVNISAKKAKYAQIANKWYGYIKEKEIEFIIVNE